MKKGLDLGINFFSKSKKAQLTVFVIIGLILVAGIVGYFFIKGSKSGNLSKNLEPAYDAYLSCIQQRVEEATNIIGQQAGYLYTEELNFEPGSFYMPFSSQLDFYGSPVPYWSYVSGNNILRQQKPSLSKIETDIERYVHERINDCDLSNFNDQGIFADIYDGNVSVKINDHDIVVKLDNPVALSFENESAYVSKHEINVKSELGNFYSLASRVYELEKNNSFLELYAVDVLRMNAPVTGVDVTCTPKMFNENEITKNLSEALEANFAFLKLKGDYYKLDNPENSYFVVDAGKNVDVNANFVYSNYWPTKVVMYGDKFAKPVGNQEGLGMLGFCFVPYNFVYDVAFPVMIQFYSNDELFQFPVVVVLKNNQPRNATYLSDEENIISPICNNPSQEVKVSTYDLSLKPVESYLTFSCLSESCSGGQTKSLAGEASANLKLPSCVNGVLTATAEGYAPSHYTISTNREFSADILMKKIYSVKVSLPNVKKATVVFSSEDYTSVLTYPDYSSVDLVEGEYNITAYVYQDSTITFPAVKDRRCFDVAETTFSSLLGDSGQQCYDIDIPSQEVDMALVGGGNGVDYFTEDVLSTKQLKLDIPIFKTPANLEELQNNYITWEDSTISTQWQ